MLKTTLFIKIIVPITILMIGFIVVISIYSLPNIDETINTLERENANEVLNSVIAISKNANKDIDQYKEEILKIHKENLKDMVFLIIHILNHYDSEAQKGILTLQDAKQEAFDKIGQIQYKKGYGHFFISAEDTKLLSHPNKTIIGKNFYYVKDKKGNYFARNIIKACNKNGEVFMSYWWRDESGELKEKLSYIKLYKPWKVYVGTGIYIDEIEKKIEKRKATLIKELKKMIQRVKVAEHGYIFVMDKDGKMILHPNKELEGVNAKYIINPTSHNSFYKDIKTASKTKEKIFYEWNKPKDSSLKKYDKISWVRYSDELGWYFVTSIYIDDLNIYSNKLKKSILLLGATILILFFIILYILLKREKKLLEQARLVQMGEMTSMIAHQWRQPLGAINSSIISMKMKIEREKQHNPDNQFLDYLEQKHNKINDYTNFLSSTVDDFRDFFAPAKKKTLTPINEPVEKALNIFEVSMKNSNIKVEVNFETTAKVLMHKSEVTQVILSILKNCEDNFIEKKIQKRRIKISTIKTSSKNKILIQDNGGGIDRKIINKIFRPYFSTKLEKNGTGLGLYMSKVIIEEHHNGHLYAKNTSQGALFTIILE